VITFIAPKVDKLRILIVYTVSKVKQMPTVQKWGNSLGIRVPKAVAVQVRLHKVTHNEFDTGGGLLTIRPKRRRRYTLAGLLRLSKGRTPHRELDRDKPVGREIL